MYRALFFDVDDTLLNFDQCSQEAFYQSWAAVGLPYSDAVYRSFREIDRQLWNRQKEGLLSVQEVLDQRFQEVKDRWGLSVEAAVLQKTFQDALARAHKLEPGAYRVVKQLSASYRLYVTSNGVLDMQRSRLALAGLLPFFSDLFVSDDIGADKPDPAFFEESLRRSGEHREEILLIGDSLEADIAGAAASRIDACWYRCHNRPAPTEIPIRYTISSLQQLAELLL